MNSLNQLEKSNARTVVFALDMLFWFGVFAIGILLPLKLVEGASAAATSLGTIIILAFLCENIVTRFRQQANIISRLRDHWQPNAWGSRVKLIFTLALSTLTIHSLACFYLLTFTNNATDFGTQYNLALYWTITTLTTVGYGDITPTDNLSRIYTMLVMMLGVGFYGFIIGQVSQYISKNDRRRDEEKEKLEELASFFKHYNIPAHLQQQTASFYQHILQKRARDTERDIIASLPAALQHELKIYLNIKPLSDLSIFRGCSTNCLAAAAAALEQVFYAPGEAVFAKGELGEDMFIIGWGQVKVHSQSRTIAILNEGQCFGEMALVLSETRGADVTAESYCDLFKLTKNRFKALLDEHQDLRKNVKEIVLARQAAA